MLSMVAIVLVVVWLLGSISSFTAGGFLHILLILPVCLVLSRVIRGRSVLS